MTEASERRTYRRVPFTAQVEAEAEGRIFTAVACDISLGGMKIFTANPVAAGQRVTLTFLLPGATRTIRARAVVRHLIVGQGMGVEFESLAPADIETINAFVAAHS
jgi:uncharacterized protein (TIGR02266 family)